jgi:hypothetical protein
LRTLSGAGIALEIGSPLESTRPASMALDTPNALIPVGAPSSFVLSGTLAHGRISGAAEIAFPAEVIIPTLPDPYAGVYLGFRESSQGDVNRVAAEVTWGSEGLPALRLKVLDSSASATSFALLDISSREDHRASAKSRIRGVSCAWAGSDHGVRAGTGSCRRMKVLTRSS